MDLVLEEVNFNAHAHTHAKRVRAHARRKEINMRICMKCYKNIKNAPANKIGKKDKTHYLICNNCLKTESIQGLIKRNNWEVILDCPSYTELANKK